MNYTYYLIEICGADLPALLHYANEKSAVYLSRHVRASSIETAAQLESEELAHQFTHFALEALRKRHGADTTLRVIACQTTETRKTKLRVSDDSTIVRARIITRNLAANRPVDMTVLK